MKKSCFFLCFFLMIACGAPLFGADDGLQGQTPALFEAAAIAAMAKEDGEALEAAYLGKRIAVSGVVTETGISIYATPYVRLSDREEGEAMAVCVLPRLDAAKLLSFKKGESVTLEGRLYRAGSERVVLKECVKIED